MRRQIKEIEWGERPPRAWQQRAYEACVQKYKAGSKDFLCVATPGAGKTRFNLWVTHDFMKSGIANMIIVVVPSDMLRKQWAVDATSFGLDLDPDFKNGQGCLAADYHGLVTTYASVAKDPQTYLNLVRNNRIILVMDEGHHAGESKAWGDAIKMAFDTAIFRLLPSGTPFRSDDCEIPFVQYVNGVGKSDFEYTYAEAIEDNVCRSVYFHAYDGSFQYKVGEEQFDHTFQDHIEKDLVSKRLRTALHTSGNWLKEVIQEADKMLCEIRAEHKDAGGLIFAIDQKHANEIVKVVHALTGQKPEIVTSEDTDGTGKIDRFKFSRDCWIVCVKMISEGVDIPRLRLGVYATNVKAELFFRQAVGRFVRILKTLGEQNAHIFIPKDRDIVKMAQEIEQEREHALENAKKASGLEDGEECGELFSEYVPARKGRFVVLGSEVTTSDLLQVNSGVQAQARARNEEPSVFQIKNTLKYEINQLAKKLALKESFALKLAHPEFNKYHKLWIEKGGKPIEQETIEELQRRAAWLKSFWYNNIQHRSI